MNNTAGALIKKDAAPNNSYASSRFSAALVAQRPSKMAAVTKTIEGICKKPIPNKKQSAERIRPTSARPNAAKQP